MTSQDLPFRITMQHLVSDLSYCLVPDVDARLTGAEELLPPALQLFLITCTVLPHISAGKRPAYPRKLTDLYQLTLIRRSFNAPPTATSSDPDDDNDDDYIPVIPPRIREHSEECG